MSFQVQSNHYRLSSQAYGAFNLDSVSLNGPPSALYLPQGVGKTMGQNSRTIVPGFALSQTRSANQDIKWEVMATGPASGHKGRYNLKELFLMFDTSGDGVLDLGELRRAFRALGLQKKSGKKMDVDERMFAGFDYNGDGTVDVEELDANLTAKTRAKIEEKLDEGWTFDEELWAASKARHARWNMAKVFKQFDTSGDGKLTMREFMRAFRALGLKKRSGEKISIDEAMFKSFDTNGDGVVTLQEFEDNLHPKTRAKIEEKLNEGWKFDKGLWEASIARHAE
jgi:Ca2+-binding EF-hand superfamily protein